MNDAYNDIFKAIEKVLEEGYRTIDIMSEGCKQVGTAEMGDLVLAKL
jgi:3-isopropylmalate dehydrogenase